MRARGKAGELLELVRSEGEGVRVGRVVAYQRGEVRVDFDGNRAGPVAARVTSALDDAALAHAAAERAEAVLLFERGDPARPIVVALLRSSTPLVDAVLAEGPPPKQLVARVDGKRVVIEGEDEVTLRCGKATLTLDRKGKVVLRGVNVVSQAEQIHKVRGGKVQIN